MIILIFIGGVWLYAVLASLYWYLKARRLYNCFGKGKNMSPHLASVNEMFHLAGTSYKSKYEVPRAGLSIYYDCDIGLMCNEEKYRSEVEKAFQRTISVYHKKLLETIFPVKIIFFPSYITLPHGGTMPALLKSLLTFLYWVIGVILAYHINVFLDYFYKNYLILWFS